MSEIQELLELQKVDLELDSIKERRKEIPKEIEELKRNLQEEEEKFQQFIAELKELERKQRKRELDLTSAQQALEKYIKQLYELKSNEEYQKMQHQIEMQKELITSLEDEILDIMEKQEEMELRKPKEEENLRRTKEEIERKIKSLEKELHSLDDKVLILQDQRNVRLKKVPKQLVSKYEKLRQVRGGAVVVPIKNGTCGGCHVELPIQLIHQLQIKEEEGFAFCENCGRLLYWSDDKSPP
jgi:hypothetical protein